MSEAKHLTKETFAEAISKGIAVVDFWAEWCGPCRMFGPVLDKVATELEGKATVGKINADEAKELAVKYTVRTLPTILIFKDGELMKTFVGPQDKNTLMKAVESL